jgi:excisionase family DNA binding protein
MENQDRFYTPTEVAAVLRVSRITVTRAIKTGNLKAFRIGGQSRIRKLDVTRWVKINATPPNAGFDEGTPTQIRTLALRNLTGGVSCRGCPSVLLVHSTLKG